MTHQLARLASYVVGDRTYWVTTIIWDSYWGPRPESGIRDLEQKGDECFTLIQHDEWDLRSVHAEIVRLLKLELSPETVRTQIYRKCSEPLGWRV